MFIHETRIRLHHTDAAGVVFYGNVFKLAQDCFEAFFDEHMPLASIIHSGDLSIPIVHARADYRHPMRLSDRITIEMALGKRGSQSFELRYQIKNPAGTLCADVFTTHAAINKNTSAATSISEALGDILTRL